MDINVSRFHGSFEIYISGVTSSLTFWGMACLGIGLYMFCMFVVCDNSKKACFFFIFCVQYVLITLLTIIILPVLIIISFCLVDELKNDPALLFKLLCPNGYCPILVSMFNLMKAELLR